MSDFKNTSSSKSIGEIRKLFKDEKIFNFNEGNEFFEIGFLLELKQKFKFAVFANSELTKDFDLCSRFVYFIYDEFLGLDNSKIYKNIELACAKNVPVFEHSSGSIGNVALNLYLKDKSIEGWDLIDDFNKAFKFLDINNYDYYKPLLDYFPPITKKCI